MKLLNRKIILSMVIMLFLLVWAQGVQAKVKLTFAEEIQCADQRIVLGKIAKIEGEASLIEKLKKIDLGPAPLPGKKFTLTQSIVTGNIVRMGVKIEDIELIGITPKGITVWGAGQKLSEELLLERAYEYVYSQLPQQYEQVQITIKSYRDLWVPLGDYQIEMGPHHSSKIWGYLSLPVKILINGEEYKTSLSLEVRIFQTVLVASEPINRGDRIKAEQVQASFLDITQTFGTPVVELKDILGKVTTRAIGKGDIVLKEYLEEQKMILRNDQVTIDVRLSSVHIQTIGKALQDGALGEWIDVLNLASGITIKAQVIGSGQVQAKAD